jgi:hypothetical protein
MGFLAKARRSNEKASMKAVQILRSELAFYTDVPNHEQNIVSCWLTLCAVGTAKATLEYFT